MTKFYIWLKKISSLMFEGVEANPNGWFVAKKEKYPLD